MKDLRLTDIEIELLSQLIGQESVSIIWDINAFYFNIEEFTFKLECFDEHPEGSDFEYDEIFFCRFTKLKKKEKFKEGDSSFWFKIISIQAIIKDIDIVEVAQKFPDNQLVDIDELGNEDGINKVSLGLVLKTNEGIVPAVLLPSNHGFSWPDKYEFYSLSELEEILETEIKIYKIKKVPNKVYKP